MRHLVVAVEMAFAGGAADHQGARRQESRPQSPQRGECRPRADHGGTEILVEHEERRDRAHLAGRVAQREIAVVEALPDAARDDLVIAAVLALAGECARPAAAARDLFAGHHVDGGAAGRDDGSAAGRDDAAPRCKARSGWNFRDSSFMNGPRVSIESCAMDRRSEFARLRSSRLRSDVVGSLTMTSDVPEILFDRRGTAGIVTLNRPKALNAVTHGHGAPAARAARRMARRSRR